MLHLRVNVATGTTRAQLNAMFERIDAGSREVVKQQAYFLRDTARKMMEGGRSGIHHSHLPNRSSARGESPRTQSGVMAKSIRLYSNGSRYYTVGSPLWYAKFLQEKRERPLMEPALEKIRPDFYKAIRDMVERSVR